MKKVRNDNAMGAVASPMLADGAMAELASSIAHYPVACFVRFEAAAEVRHGQGGQFHCLYFQVHSSGDTKLWVGQLLLSAKNEGSGQSLCQIDSCSKNLRCFRSNAGPEACSKRRPIILYIALQC